MPLRKVSASTSPKPEGTPAAPTTPARWPWLRPALLLGMVPVIGFLLAAFPARNSDLWFHLAKGLWLAGGQFARAADPSGSAGLCVNHSWLTDLLAYWLYQGLGGWGLVFLKALVFAAVALLMLLLGWKFSPGNHLPLAVLCTLLAVVPMAQAMALRSIVLSFLFLALTLWILERARLRPVSSIREGLVQHLPLFLLCALWVNLDAWFVLGPLTVGLYLLGDWLTGPRHKPGAQATGSVGPVACAPGLCRGRTGLLACVLTGSLLACLFNPSHVWAFQVPPPLSLVSTRLALHGEAVASALFLSPFDKAYPAGLFSNLPGLAYYLLASLSLLSFLLNRARWRDRAVLTWGLLWLVFFSLSALHYELIPFFAIVAGPVLVRNLSAWLAEPKRKHSPGTTERWERNILATAVLLAFLAWPGLLQAPPWSSRSLQVQKDLGQERMAAKLVQWHKEGYLSSDQPLFNTSLETAHYLAWVSASTMTGGELPSGGKPIQLFLDGRFPLLPASTLERHSRIVQGLRSPRGMSLLQREKINLVVLSAPT